MSRTATKSRTSSRPRQTPEEREAKVSALKEQLHAAVLGLNEHAKWTEFLETVSNFGAQYSWGNQLLILAQAQARGFEPTMVMPFGTKDKTTGKGRTGWLKLGRSPRKGEKGLQIWAPVKTALTDEEIETYQAKGWKTHTADGRRIKKLRTWTVGYTFDVSQTDGDPVEVPEPTVRRVRTVVAGPQAQLLTGEDTTGALAHVIQLILDRGLTYERVPAQTLGTANGDSTMSRVRVRDDVSDAQAVKTTVHELAHVMLRHPEDMAEYRRHRGRMETEVESVAYIVCGALGLDTGAYSAPYVSSWSQGDQKVLEETAQTVVRTASTILRELEAYLSTEDAGDDHEPVSVPEPAIESTRELVPA